MYRILLADDDILDLEGMKTFIPWRDLGMEVAGTANNGFAALEILEREPVDVLVSDIRMPNMTGLELAQRAREKRANLRVIFVSGHQDFQYAKQAMSLNAFGYVLKPMDDRELVGALLDVKRELDSERTRHEKEETYRQLVPAAKNDYLLRLLESEPDSADSAALRRQFCTDDWDWPLRVYVVEIDDYASKLGQYAPEARKAALSQLEKLLIGGMHAQGVEQICKLSKTRYAVLANARREEELFGPFMAGVRQTLPFTLTIGTGVSASCSAELQHAYGEALAALDQKMLRGKDRILAYEASVGSELKDLKDLDRHLEAMMLAVSAYDLVRIHDELSHVFQLVSQYGSRITIRHFAMYVLMKMNEQLRSANEDLYKLLGLELKNLEILLELETIGDIHAWLRRRVFELSETIQAKRQTKNGKLVQSIVEHIRSRLDENITLRDVAERFSFSPNYLGLLFKEETSRNFSEYVVDLRMEKAQQLLTMTKLKIYEVADMVGYRYLPYFSRQFKETTGMTPLEYRRKH